MNTINHETGTIDATLWRRRDALGLIGLAAASLAGFPAAAQTAARKGGVLKVSANSNPSTLDPARGSNGFDHVFLWTMFDTLVDWDPATLTPKPGMAEWSFPDATTMLLKIKPNIQFHDGTPCDAAAVKANIERSRSSNVSNIRAELSSISQVTVTGPDTVKLTLSQPDATLPAVFSDRAGMMASPKAMDAAGDGFGRQPVGAGPWRFVSWTDNQKVVVERNPTYWRTGLPHLDGIEMSIIPELPTGLRSVVSKQNQLVYGLPPRLKPVVERDKSLNMVTGPTLFCYIAYMNYGRKPLDNPKLRKAINLAIDRETLVKATMADGGEAAQLVIPRNHWAYDKEVAALTPFDPDRARQLMKEAGLEGGIDLTIANYADQDSVRRGEILVDNLSRIGVRAKLVSGTVAEISAQYFKGDTRFDMLSTFWSGRPDLSMTYSLMFDKGAFFNAGRVEGAPGLQELLLQSRQKEDREFRRGVFSKLQRIVAENALYVPLAIQYQLTASAKQVKAVEGNLLGKPKFNNIWVDA